MSTGFRIFWVISLTIFVSGCSGYATTAIPRTGDPNTDSADFEADTIKPGDKVRVTLLDGQQVLGNYVGRDAEALTVHEIRDADLSDESGHYGGAPNVDKMHVIPVRDVARVEGRKKSNDGAVLALVGFSVLIVALLANSMKDAFDMGFDVSD